MRNIKIFRMMALLIFPLIGMGNNERIVHRAAQECPLLSYLENKREKLSPQEMKAYNTLIFSILVRDMYQELCLFYKYNER